MDVTKHANEDSDISVCFAYNAYAVGISNKKDDANNTYIIIMLHMLKRHMESLVAYLKRNKLFFVATKKPRKYKQVATVATVPRNSYYIHTASDPMHLTTRIDGEDEVHNIVQRGDVIITGPKGEQYCMSPTKFISLYNVIDGVAVPRPVRRMMAHVTSAVWKRVVGATVDKITFKTGWGEDMILRPGDYIVRDGASFYRVSKSVFATTYQLKANGAHQIHTCA